MIGATKAAPGQAALPQNQAQAGSSGATPAPKKREPYNPALGAPPSLNHRHGVVMNELHGLARFKASAQATFSRLMPGSSRIAPSPPAAPSVTPGASASTSGSRAAAAAPLASTPRAPLTQERADRKATQAPAKGLLARMVAQLKRSDAPTTPAASQAATPPAGTVGPASGTVVRRQAEERAPAFLRDATVVRKAVADASPPAAAPQQPATLSALVFEGDNHRTQTVYVASRTQAPSRLSRNFLGLDPDLKFEDRYGFREFHGVVADELLTVRRLAKREGQTLREHLSDDDHLKGRPPREGRRIRAQLLNIRNEPHARLNRVLALFAERLHKEADLAKGGIDKEVEDLVAFSNDLQYGRVKQLIAGTPEFERFKAMKGQGRGARPASVEAAAVSAAAAAAPALPRPQPREVAPAGATGLGRPG